VVACRTHLDLVHRDGEMVTANRLARKRQHAPQRENVLGQIAAIGEKGCERLRCLDRDQFGDEQSASADRDRWARCPIAVGTLIAERPPHRTVQAAFPHTAPTLGV
jgi:hypothetical protein